MPTPFIKNNNVIYGCSECSDDIDNAPMLEHCSSFYNEQSEININIYVCVNCHSVYFSINDSFLEGSFKDIKQQF